jgi:sulfur-oxidizing protein SoxY
MSATFRLLLLLAAVAAAPQLALADKPDNIWEKVRASLFGNRPISEQAADVIELDTPVRAEDAATVPIAIRTRLTQGQDRYVRKIYLVIDKNPSPLGAVFSFTPASELRRRGDRG